MLCAKQRAIVLAILGSVDRGLALFDHGAYGMHVFLAARVRTAMEDFAWLPANTAHLLAFGISIILNDCSRGHRLRNAEAFETGLDVAEQACTNAMQPTRVLTTALEEAPPSRAQHTLDSTERLLLHAQHARPASIRIDANVVRQ